MIAVSWLAHTPQPPEWLDDQVPVKLSESLNLPVIRYVPQPDCVAFTSKFPPPGLGSWLSVMKDSAATSSSDDDDEKLRVRSVYTAAWQSELRTGNTRKLPE